jgi:hypothetical protein
VARIIGGAQWTHFAGGIEMVSLFNRCAHLINIGGNPRCIELCTPTTGAFVRGRRQKDF